MGRAGEGNANARSQSVRRSGENGREILHKVKDSEYFRLYVRAAGKFLIGRRFPTKGSRKVRRVFLHANDDLSCSRVRN